MNILDEIPKEGAEHRVQEIFKGMQLLLRKYNKISVSEKIVASLKPFMKSLTENDAIASALWILGEYCHIFEDAINILEFYAKGLVNYERNVQLQLLNCSVKIYLKINQSNDSKYSKLNGEKMDELMTSLLEKVTEFDNPDLRDRAFIYWRLLSLEDNLKDVFEAMNVKGQTVIMEQYSAIEPELVEHLIKHIALTSSVFHDKSEKLFPVQHDFDKRGKAEEAEGEGILTKSPTSVKQKEPKKEEEKAEVPSPTGKGTGEINIIDLDFGPENPSEEKGKEEQPTGSSKIGVKRGIKKLPIGQAARVAGQSSQSSDGNNPISKQADLLDLDFSGQAKNEPVKLSSGSPGQDLQLIDFDIGATSSLGINQNGTKGSNQEEEDLFGMVSSDASGKKSFEMIQPEKGVVLARSTSGRGGQKGLEIKGVVELQKDGEVFLILEVENLTPLEIGSTFDLQMKPNYFYLQPEKLRGISIPSGVSKTIPVRLMKSSKGVSTSPSYPLAFTVGLKCNLDTFFFDVPCFIHSLVVKLLFSF